MSTPATPATLAVIRKRFSRAQVTLVLIELDPVTFTVTELDWSDCIFRDRLIASASWSKVGGVVNNGLG